MAHLKAVYRGLRIIGLVLFYYVFSIGITFYNKWLMKDFHYPLFMTLVHITIIFSLSAITRRILHSWTGKPRVLLSWTDYLHRAAPTALATALDIGLSNWSLLFITISLYTMTKTSAKPLLVLVVLLISGGLFMFTFESTQFHLEGFLMVLLASFLGGIRWTLTQVLMQKAELGQCEGPGACPSCVQLSSHVVSPPGLHNPVDALYHLQPLMFIGLFPLFQYNEGLSLSTSDRLFRLTELSPVLHALLTLGSGGLLAFGLSFSEFLLVSCTSSLTLSIAGILKEVSTLLLAAFLMGDEVSALNWLGFAVCVCGISLHVGLKACHAK
ncbi:unnamed protein product, partial [Tetraodon nigroviridis]